MWKRFILASKCIGAGFLFSMAIEVSQLLTKRGYFQTDDILTNVLGSIIGYITAYGLISIIKYLKD
jgi:glycopeptide antibiotics resistance protein